MGNTQAQEYVSAKTGAKRLDMGESSWWAKVRNGELPQPDLKMGKRCTRWNWQNVVSFLEKQNGKGAEQSCN